MPGKGVTTFLKTTIINVMAKIEAAYYVFAWMHFNARGHIKGVVEDIMIARNEMNGKIGKIIPPF